MHLFHDNARVLKAAPRSGAAFAVFSTLNRLKSKKIGGFSTLCMNLALISKRVGRDETRFPDLHLFIEAVGALGVGKTHHEAPNGLADLSNLYTV